ncbi:MAG TPA: Mov34/MPN/PAD-1 family protein [Kofleriaceae bacterium]|nr:Mov34/MPN/PAD-1 family protein [Kofleriaceae bacterium]
MSALDVRSIVEKDLRKEQCPATKQEFRVFLSEAAFDRAVARGDSDTTREIGGVLVGEVLRDDAGPYLRIESTIDALHAEEKGAELTFTHATWDHIHKEMDEKHQNKRVVGWYHTHPGFGVFLSDRDQFIHKSFFNLPFQVAFVYDPKSHEHGVFTWHDNEVWRARRYWIGPREQAWDGPRITADASATPTRKAARPGDDRERDGRPEEGDAREARDELSLSGSLGMLIVVGVVLLLVGGFVGHWVGTSATNQVIAEAQVEIGKAKLESVQIEASFLQANLVDVLRDTLGDEELRRPIAQAIESLDRALAWLPGSAAAPAAPGTGSAAPGAGSAAPGSAAPAAPAAPAGSGAPAAPAAPAVAGAPAAPAASGDARLAELATQLRAARERLFAIAGGRASAQRVLSELEAIARHGSELRADLGRDVAEQRSGLGTLYSELAADAIKAGDPGRARRLLATAAHLDPGNRSRYEQQLQSFDKDASLPRDTGGATGTSGQGTKR